MSRFCTLVKTFPVRSWPPRKYPSGRQPPVTEGLACHPQRVFLCLSLTPRGPKRVVLPQSLTPAMACLLLERITRP